MNEALTITTERVDDIPLLLAQMQRMDLARLLDAHFVMLATLDPLGLPLVTEVLSGERADDPLYLPAITRVRACLNRTGLLYVGDVKMSALGTRASIQAAGAFYLCPLSTLQVSAQWLAQQVAALRELLVRRQGKPVLAERAAVEQAVADTLVQFRVEGLLRVTVSEQVTEQRVRAYRERPATVRTQSRFTISSQMDPEALTSAIEQLGWRVYATNQVADGLSLAQAVEAYRDEYLVERNFGRLKGHPLSLSPMYVERDEHATGLVRLLSLAFLVLPLLEFVVRRHLAQERTSLAGLYAGNPKRATTHPTTERLLEAFQEMSLTLVIEPHQTRRHVTVLSPLKP